MLVHAQGPLQVAFNVGADRLDTNMGAWDTLSLPGGCVRQFVNAGDEDAQALLVVHGDARKDTSFRCFSSCCRAGARCHAGRRRSPGAPQPVAACHDGVNTPALIALPDTLLDGLYLSAMLELPEEAWTNVR